MTEQEMRIAIAASCGVVCKQCKGTGKYLRYGSHEWFRISLGHKDKKIQPEVSCDHVTYDEHFPYTELLPDYPNDLNAMHEAEQKLLDTPNAWPRYLDELSSIQPAPLTVRAKAKQRAEAFLKTIGKWKE